MVRNDRRRASRDRGTFPPPRYERTARLGEVLREVLADGIERLSDPRLGFVTLTGVDVAPDLRQATVYYSVLGPESDTTPTAEALRSASTHLQAVIGRQVRMKYTPHLLFRPDPAVSAGGRVEEIIRRLQGPASTAGPDREAGDE